jgi:hypothetical protein
MPTKQEIYARIADQVVALVEEQFRADARDEPADNWGYAPQLCPNCSLYLDHTAYWRRISPESIIVRIGCDSCDSVNYALVGVRANVEPE